LIPIRKVLDFRDGADINTERLMGYVTTHKLNGWGGGALAKLCNVLLKKPVVHYFREDEQSLDRVLNLFVRLNSGGIPPARGLDQLRSACLGARRTRTLHRLERHPAPAQSTARDQQRTLPGPAVDRVQGTGLQNPRPHRPTIATRLAAPLRYRPVLFGTFVETPRHRGTCYKAAANWIHIGQTTGRGKTCLVHQPVLPVKDIWLYPLSKHFRAALCD
jgi:hypothetical protein